MKGDDHVLSALSEGTARFNHVINMISCYGKNLFFCMNDDDSGKLRVSAYNKNYKEH